MTLMSAIMAEPLDRGTDHFDPSNLEFTSVDVGNRTVNLIPAEARARFNIRYNDLHTPESLKALIEKRCAAAAGNATRNTCHHSARPPNDQTTVCSTGQP